MLILSRFKEDTTWVDMYLNIPHVVYQGGNPSAIHPVLPDAGLESLAYLRFILDNYDNLPDHMAFIHAHRTSRHVDDMVPLLQHLKWDADGFFNLNVRYMYGRFQKKLLEEAEVEYGSGNVLEDPIWQKKYHTLAQTAYIRQFWRDYLTPYYNETFPDVVASPCCAQFVVSKERVLRHPKELYRKIADWLVSMQIPSHWSARVMEYTWHVLWGNGPVEKQRHLCDVTEGLCGQDSRYWRAPLIMPVVSIDAPPVLEWVMEEKEWKRAWKEDRHKRGWKD
jgi:hypothetical protein